MTINYIPGLSAGSDLSAKQYHAVQLDEDFRVDAITNANAPQIPVGILQNDPVSGEAAEVAGPGSVAVAELGGTVTYGQHLVCNDDGELIAGPFEAAIGTADLYVVAQALQDGVDGEKIKVLVLSPVPGSTE